MKNPDSTVYRENKKLLPDPAEIQALLAGEYAALEEVDQLAITHIKFKEKLPVQFLFEGEAESGQRVYLSAQQLPEEKGLRIAERLNFPAGDSPECFSMSNQQSHAVYSIVLGLLFQLFPEDRHLPALSSLMEVKSVEAIIRSTLSGTDADSTLKRLDCTVMRYKPHRKCVIRYDLLRQYKGNSVASVVYGKVARKKTFVNTHPILHHLQQVMSETGPALPKQLAVIPELCLELISAVPGIPLSNLCESARFPHYCTVTAKALACFHNAPAKLPLHWSVSDKIARIYQDAAALVVLFPEERQRIRRLESTLALRFRSLPEIAPQLIHRDFHGMNVLLHNDDAAGDVAGFIDLEDCAMGDPAEDVGSMYGHLSRLSFEQPALAAQIIRGRAAFLQGYPGVLVEKSVQAHCALYCFYQALQQLRHPQFSYRYNVTRALLGECERVLAMDFV